MLMCLSLLKYERKGFFQSNPVIIRRHQVCFPTWLRLVFRPSCPCFLCTVSLICRPSYLDKFWFWSFSLHYLLFAQPLSHLWAGSDIACFYVSFPFSLSSLLWAGCQKSFEDFCASNWRSFHFLLKHQSFMWAGCERIENSTFIASTGFVGVSVFLSSFGGTCLFATQ